MGRAVFEKDVKIDFSDALNVLEFDDNRRKEKTYGLSHCMAAVDFIVEWDKYYWFVEIKDPETSTALSDEIRHAGCKKVIDEFHSGNLISKNLAPKIKDSFIYTKLQKTIDDKPIFYMVLLGISSLNEPIANHLATKLKHGCGFFGPHNKGWESPYLRDVIVLNIAQWNRTFPHCPITRTSPPTLP
ncbi:hypothetical protein [Magnetospirillum sp. ME-1]|uniref:hypothetical protein n=1 Tax=Magnetospirillum sp. ME-1 TaxID=1639348 RepID=UPI0011AE4DC4|nr:hypothetical protein [Magnetospirillum sp. ME-1]